jgi:hypothetical protein
VGLDGSPGDGVQRIADQENALHVFLALVPVVPGLLVIPRAQVGDPAAKRKAVLQVQPVDVRSLESKPSVLADIVGCLLRVRQLPHRNREGEKVLLRGEEQGLVVGQQFRLRAAIADHRLERLFRVVHVRDVE